MYTTQLGMFIFQDFFLSREFKFPGNQLSLDTPFTSALRKMVNRYLSSEDTDSKKNYCWHCTEPRPGMTAKILFYDERHMLFWSTYSSSLSQSRHVVIEYVGGHSDIWANIDVSHLSLRYYYVILFTIIKLQRVQWATVVWLSQFHISQQLQRDR